MPEDTYTIKEFIAHYLDDMKEKTGEMFSDIKEIKAQTQKTNGRVIALEVWSNDAKKIIESQGREIKKQYGFRKYFLGYMAGIVFILGFTGWFAIKYLIKESITQVLINNNQSYETNTR